MNILKKQKLNNKNNISNFEIFSLSKNNDFIKSNLLTSSKNFFYINSDDVNDFFHKTKKTTLVKYGKYNNQLLLNHNLSKKHYIIQFTLLFYFLKQNKIQILQGRILNFSKTIKKMTKKIDSSALIKKTKKSLSYDYFFIISILGLVFKFKRQYLTSKKFKSKYKNNRFENSMKGKSFKFFFIEKNLNLQILKIDFFNNLRNV